ncbi:MAG: hypothetical protein JW846_11290 [Dehalococcoidia bacterium]|nr:hypothetical protein [Dehalococcoidia bacterium]
MRQPIQFGTSGIRGIVGTDITAEVCARVGLALGTFLGRGSHVCLARDSRLSGPLVAGWLTEALVAAGLDVVDLGMVPTPVLAAITRMGGHDAGVMVTASHNPPAYNGVKLFSREGIGFSRQQERAIEVLCDIGDHASGRGHVIPCDDPLELYMQTLPQEITEAAARSSVRVLLDPGNGAASGFVRRVYDTLGIGVDVVNDEPDGTFPGRGPEPARNVLDSTVRQMACSGCGLAACFDGDADRVVFCDSEGFLGLDEMVAWVARCRVLETGKKCLATTVETGRLPEHAVEEVDGHVVRGVVGDVAVAHLAQEQDAALGAESVGVYIFPDVGLYPESILGSLYVLGMCSRSTDIRRFVASLPAVSLAKRKIACPACVKNRVMEVLAANPDELAGQTSYASVDVTDGVRIEWDDSWLLVRPSGTEPVIRVTAEGAHAGDVGRDLAVAVSMVEALVERERRG